jgi:hypothetical protein
VQLVCYTHASLTPPVRNHHAAQLHVFVMKKDPEIVVLSNTISDHDVALVNNLVTAVFRGFAASVYPPNRDAFICSRRHCPYWRECEEQYGGRVKP